MIRLENVSKSFDEKIVISSFSFEFKDGNSYAIIGDSGKGKTTLLNLICSIIQPDSGNVITNKPVSISAVFQEDRLFEHLSAIDNVMVATKLKNRQLVIGELSVLLPSDELEKPVSELSGGMRRRVAIVRAILARSDVVILDEPFAGLDENNINNAFSYILKRKLGRTLIMTSHNFSFPYDFEKIVL